MAALTNCPCERCPRRDAGFVLVVDDDEDTRGVVDRILGRAGYRVATATNAREALERLHAGPEPCAVLLDLAMPIMDGWAFLRERQGDPTVRRVPIALMSGSIDRRAMALDTDGYLAKPFDASQLLATVQRCCAALDARGPRP